MRTQNLKQNRNSQHLQKSSPKRRSKTPLACELKLNEAYDSLNSAELKIQSISTEMGDLLANVLDVAAKLYRNSHILYHNKEFKKSETFAKASLELSELIDALAEQELENALSLPLPPPLAPEAAAKPLRSKSVHPSLLAFESLLKRRSSSGSKHYNQKLYKFPRIISQATSCLKEIESVH